MLFYSTGTVAYKLLASELFSGLGGGDIGGFSKTIFIVILIIAAVIFAITIYAKRDRTINIYVSEKTTDIKTMPNRQLEIEGIILGTTDSQFSGDKFCETAKQTFILTKQACMLHDTSTLRNLMDPLQFKMTDQQVQDDISNNIAHHYDDITFSDVYLTSYTHNHEFEYLAVILKVTYLDYEVDTTTGEIVRGSNKNYKTEGYRMRYKKSIASIPNLVNCPTCGAPLRVVTSGACSYCGRQLIKNSSTWVVCELALVLEDAPDDGIR